MSVQKRSWVRTVLRSRWGKIGIALFLIACIQVGPMATILFYYLREQMVVRQIVAVGGSVHFQSIAPTRRSRFYIDLLERTPLYNRVKIVILTDREVSPALCAGFVHLKHLDWLGLEGTGVGDEQMKPIRQMSSLTILDLDRTSVTDRGVKQLATLENLQQLFLCDTSVTDASVEVLAGHSKLLSLWVENTKISQNGLDKLRRELPKCQLKPMPGVERGIP